MTGPRPASVVLVSAYGPEARRGNASTCRRYATAATAAGVRTRWVFGEGPELDRRLRDAITDEAPDLLHGHHLLRVGPALLATRLPFVVSAGGTEDELIEADPSREATLRATAAAARRTLFAEPAARARWIASGRVDPDRADVVPRGVSVPAEPPRPRDPATRGSLRRSCGLSADAFLVLLPSGLRPGKDPLRAIRVCDAAQKVVPRLELVVLGAALDAAVARAVADAARSRPFVHVAATLPPEEMPGAYADADVVLNTSRHEGVANALLEAAAAARPAIAASIAANAAVVRDGATGALFDDDASAVRVLAEWASDPSLRAHLGRAAHAHVRERFSLAAEARALLTSYRAAVEG